MCLTVLMPSSVPISLLFAHSMIKVPKSEIDGALALDEG